MLSKLFKSRKFLIMLSDIVFSTLLYFTTKYIDPSIVDDIKFVIATYQPVVLAVIAAIAYEDAALKAKVGYIE